MSHFGSKAQISRQCCEYSTAVFHLTAVNHHRVQQGTYSQLNKVNPNILQCYPQLPFCIRTSTQLPSLSLSFHQAVNHHHVQQGISGKLKKNPNPNILQSNPPQQPVSLHVGHITPGLHVVTHRVEAVGKHPSAVSSHLLWLALSPNKSQSYGSLNYGSHIIWHHRQTRGRSAPQSVDICGLLYYPPQWWYGPHLHSHKWDKCPVSVL